MSVLTERQRKILDWIPYWLLFGFMAAPILMFILTVFMMDWKGVIQQ